MGEFAKQVCNQPSGPVTKSEGIKMQSNSKILDDVARVLTGAAGAAQGVRDEVDGAIKHQLLRLLQDMDLVTREEFDVVKAMAARAREENEALKARIEALESASQNESD
jgi:BMFP domain-containing protein YqiC